MDDVIQTAIKRYKKATDSWSEIYEKAGDDLRFLSDDHLSQWDAADAKSRIDTGRPCLQIDQLGQFIHQVANDIRMNTPTIHPVPSSVGANAIHAELYKGMIKEIEYGSRADEVYDTASLNSIKCSIGFIRVDHDYVTDDSFEQKIKLCSVRDPLSIVIDPSSVECDGRDMKYAFVFEEITIDEFKERFPDFDPVTFDDAAEKRVAEQGESVTIAEYFTVDEEYETITSPDGSTTREVAKRTVRRQVLSGKDVLEDGEFPSKYIPIVPVYGEEHWVNGKRYLFSLIRKSKDAQRQVNLWESYAQEALKKSLQSGVMAAVGQVEPFKDEWLQPEKTMVYRYSQRDAEGNPANPPIPISPPSIPLGFVDASQRAVQNIKATMGIYNSGLGEMDNSLSGVAINNRKVEGDVATFHFQDNLIRSIGQVGRILLDMIPRIYVEPRVVGIIDDEEASKMIGINGAVTGDQVESIFLQDAAYDVKVITGAAYTTQRQEAADFFTQLVTTRPEMLNVMGDLMFANMDFAGAQAMAERMKKIIDPKLLGEDEVDPQVAILTEQLQQSQAAIAALQAELNNKQQEFNLKAQSEMNDAEAEKAKIEIQMIEMKLKNEQQMRDLAIKERELAIKEGELQVKAAEVMQAATPADNNDAALAGFAESMQAAMAILAQNQAETTRLIEKAIGVQQ